MPIPLSLLERGRDKVNNRIGRCAFEMSLPKPEWFEFLKAADAYEAAVASNEHTGTMEDQLRLAAKKASVFL